MIDWNLFVESLDKENFEKLTTSIRFRREDEAELIADTLVLSLTEVKLARENPVQAIRKINERLKCGIMVAKAAVELALDSDEEEDQEVAVI